MRIQYIAIALFLLAILVLLAGEFIMVFEDGSYIVGEFVRDSNGWTIVERWISGCLPFNLCS